MTALKRRRLLELYIHSTASVLPSSSQPGESRHRGRESNQLSGSEHIHGCTNTTTASQCPLPRPRHGLSRPVLRGERRSDELLRDDCSGGRLRRRNRSHGKAQMLLPTENYQFAWSQPLAPSLGSSSLNRLLPLGFLPASALARHQREDNQRGVSHRDEQAAAYRAATRVHLPANPRPGRGSIDTARGSTPPATCTPGQPEVPLQGSPGAGLQHDTVACGQPL